MIEIGIDPVLQMGPLEVRWPTLILIISLIIVMVMGVLELKRAGMAIVWSRTVGLCLSFVIGALIGGRVLYVLDNPEEFSGHPELIFGLNGILMYGVVIGALLAVFIYTRFGRISFWEIGDAIAPGAMLGLAVYRVGCIINGCCYGVPSGLSWAVMYTNPNSVAPLYTLLHPTQIYHLVLCLIAFAVLWLLRGKLKPAGSLFLLWLVLLAITDLPVRLFRAGHPFLFGMQQAQLIGILFLLVALPWLIVRIGSARIETS